MTPGEYVAYTRQRSTLTKEVVCPRCGKLPEVGGCWMALWYWVCRR